MKNWFLKNVLRGRNALPQCSAYIRFRQAPGRGQAVFGEFLFVSADVEQALMARIVENPHLGMDQEGAILQWVQGRDDNIQVPVSMPYDWWRFQYTVDDLLNAGHGEMFCLQCQTKVFHEQLPKDESQTRGNWVFNTLKCPEGHPLLDMEMLHYSVIRKH